MNSKILQIVSKVIHILPATNCFAFKCTLYRLAGVKIGKNVRIYSSAKLIGSGYLEIGDNTWIGPEVMIISTQRVVIGANCDIAPRVYIGDGTHKITPTEKRIAGIECCNPIIIGDGCWICTGAHILAGVNIGEKCIIAAGAVVTKSCNEHIMIAGIPARKVRSLL